MSDGGLHEKVVVDQISGLPEVDLQCVYLSKNRDTRITSKLKRIMCTILLFLGRSFPVKAESLQAGDRGRGRRRQEEFGGDVGAKEATAAREDMG